MDEEDNEQTDPDFDVKSTDLATESEDEDDEDELEEGMANSEPEENKNDAEKVRKM